MKVARYDSVIVTPIEKQVEAGIIMDFNEFNEGKVISSEHELVKEGDNIYYTEGIKIGNEVVVDGQNIIAIK